NSQRSCDSHDWITHRRSSPQALGEIPVLARPRKSPGYSGPHLSQRRRERGKTDPLVSAGPAGPATEMKTLSIFLFTLITSAATLPPVDQAPRDPTLVAYRNQLATAVRNHDVKALKDLVAADIQTSFGGDTGLKPDAKFWRTMDEILPLGGTF